MTVLVVANGRIGLTDFYADVVDSADVVIAADGGADNCIKLGAEPDRVVGDMDSISDQARNKFADKLKPDDDQNATDLTKALRLAESLKADEIVIIGAIGKRIDHTLANILSLQNVTADVRIIDEHNEIFVVDDEIELDGQKGDIVSVFALSDVKGLRYKGLRWDVKDEDVKAGWSGSSNEMTGASATISLKHGKLVVVKAVE